ncbi:geranylgeranyl pyrophosphate synthase [Philodulcilactobacillus myokoensis]|uniref:Geranylgeranyl pyrophosphate synthase n=1 Tax=Philodulcilactobacillus myokoensis TaxID=2929573 RepID=A0A9W6AZX1_9LACO|nr:polyprenyl synthetase family protein [Philodulcilactobacillus myokoensis]GLB46066.1 geranylgeranyl pyrophosphate synthase [Philodulcilactobacillus myokoensis]
MDLRLWKKYPQLQHQLQTVQQIMIDQITVNSNLFKNGIDNLIDGNGKMVRSSLLLLFTNFGTQKNHDNYFEKVAASIELIHLASLVHDDVLDQSDLRRGVTTLNQDFGQRTAIYLGDFLFVKYFRLVLNAMPNIEQLKYNINGVGGILNGELQQNQTQYDLSRTKSQYLDSIKGKTAELFRIAAGNGAIISRADENTIQLIQKIGLQIGMAFQMRDDLIDFEDNAKQAGKPTLHDVLGGVYTLPIIYAMQTNDRDQLIATIKKDQLKPADLYQVKTMVENDGALAHAHQDLEERTWQIKKLIRKLPDNQARQIILDIVKMLFD